MSYRLFATTPSNVACNDDSHIATVTTHADAMRFAEQYAAKYTLSADLELHVIHDGSPIEYYFDGHQFIVVPYVE